MSKRPLLSHSSNSSCWVWVMDKRSCVSLRSIWTAITNNTKIEQKRNHITFGAYKMSTFYWTSGQRSATTIAENPLELMGHCAPDPWTTHQSYSVHSTNTANSLLYYIGVGREAWWMTRKRPLHSLTCKHHVRCWHQIQTHLLSIYSVCCLLKFHVSSLDVMLPDGVNCQ